MRLPVIDPAFVSALRTQVRGEVRTTEHDRMLYATDASIYQVAPVAVVIPRDAQDVQAAVACCHAYGAAILPRGAGTFSCYHRCMSAGLLVSPLFLFAVLFVLRLL